MNASVTIYAEKNTIDDSGDIISEWESVETLSGDVQPHTLTQDEIKVYGLSQIKGGVKLFLYNGIHGNIKPGNRASVDSALTGETDLYNIMPINAWSRHGECLLIPVENEVLSD
jgi:hypothetical protein